MADARPVRKVPTPPPAPGSAPRYPQVTFDDAATRALARADPTGSVAAPPRRTILDEIRRVPELLPTLKLAVDRARRPGPTHSASAAVGRFRPPLGH